MDINPGFNWQFGNLCGNCLQPIKDKSTTLNIQGFNGIASDAVPVPIVDAIEYIYGISWKNFLRISETHSKNVSEEMESSINLCNPCVQILAEIYLAHQRFENVRHISSIFRRLSSFRAQQSLQSLEEKQKIGDNCGPHYFDNGDDDLVESFNFEDSNKDLEDGLEIEDKFDVSDNKIQNAESTLEEVITKPNCETRITRSSIKLQQQVVIKLERLSNELNEGLLNIQNVKRPSVNKKNISPKKNTRKSSKEALKGKVKKQDSFNRKTNETDFDNCVKEVSKGYQRKSDKGRHFKCRICGLKFKDRDYYQYKHLPKHFGKGVRKTCEICGKILTSHNSFRYHMKVFHANEEEKSNLKTPCEICGTLILKCTLKLHMKQHSNSREIFKCDTCDKEYLSKKCYDEHILTHSEEFTPHLCVQCGKTFNTKSALMGHEKIHTTEKTIPCDECSLMFRNNSELNFHQQSHATERKHVCEECGKTFKFKHHLTIHLRLHREIAETGGSVKCDECGRFFKHSLSLYKHVQRFHKPDSKKTIWKCSFCDKILSSPSNLRIHEDLHKRNPDYKPRKKQTWKYVINSQANPNSHP